MMGNFGGLGGNFGASNLFNDFEDEICSVSSCFSDLHEANNPRRSRRMVVPRESILAIRGGFVCLFVVLFAR